VASGRQWLAGLAMTMAGERFLPLFESSAVSVRRLGGV
jgi:hypothetical protein